MQRGSKSKPYHVNSVLAWTYTRGSLASQLAAMSNYVALILSLATPALPGAASTSQQKALPIDEARLRAPPFQPKS